MATLTTPLPAGRAAEASADTSVALPDGIEAPAAAPAAPRYDRRTLHLLEAPLLPTLLRLAAPNVVMMMAQAATGLIETYFVGLLGTDALAGVALVFPVIMLMQMISGGAMGGAISSSIARALGGGRRDDANALVVHALISNGLLGLACAIGFLIAGHSLYGALGGTGGALEAALAYSHTLFLFMPVLWLMNALASTIRGTGNMTVPAVVICGGAILLVPLSPALIFGLGPFPALGVVGAGVALNIYNTVAAAILAAYIWSPRSLLKPNLRGVVLRWRLFADILRVGAVGSLSSLQTGLTVILTTGIVGAFGVAAIAGYGTASRLELLTIPIVFGLGAPLVALVGTNIGAGRYERALRAAAIGGVIAFTLAEAIGLAAAAWPEAWLSLFGHDPGMIEAGALYLRTTGPFFGFFGLGLVLYFASQGAGRLLWPVLANFVRLLIAVCGGWLALHLTGNLAYVFLALGLAMAAYGITVAVAIRLGAWRR